jgi:hypothetical protein
MSATTIAKTKSSIVVNTDPAVSRHVEEAIGIGTDHSPHDAAHTIHATGMIKAAE